MKISDYLKIIKLAIFSQLLIVILMNGILFSSLTVRMNPADVIYLNILIISMQLISLGYGFIKQRKKFRAFYTDTDGRIENKGVYESDFYLDLITGSLEKQQKAFREKEENYKEKGNEMQEYITQSVHDIKVNIAVCELLLDDKETENRDELSKQVEQMKFRINQLLHVSRANHYTQDLAAEEVDICLELRSAIQENALFFINRNIEIQTDLMPFSVISDKKWIHYIFSQILNNSSKYTPENGQLQIYVEQTEQSHNVHIRDHGIGIAVEDLPRIFEKGFTGRNGRLGTKSTGMGLYYAKKMAVILSIGLNVKSEQGKFTEFILIFYKLSDYYSAHSLDRMASIKP